MNLETRRIVTREQLDPTHLIYKNVHSNARGSDGPGFDLNPAGVHFGVEIRISMRAKVERHVDMRLMRVSIRQRDAVRRGKRRTFRDDDPKVRFAQFVRQRESDILRAFLERPQARGIFIFLRRRKMRRYFPSHRFQIFRFESRKAIVIFRQNVRNTCCNTYNEKE